MLESGKIYPIGDVIAYYKTLAKLEREEGRYKFPPEYNRRGKRVFRGDRLVWDPDTGRLKRDPDTGRLVIIKARPRLWRDYPFVCGHGARGIGWIRVFGYGFVVSDTKKRGLSFSERNGHARLLRVGRFVIRLLTPSS